MNLKRGFRRITLLLAIVSGIFCASIGVLIVFIAHDCAETTLRLEEAAAQLAANSKTEKQNWRDDPVIEDTNKLPSKRTITTEELFSTEELEKDQWVPESAVPVSITKEQALAELLRRKAKRMAEAEQRIAKLKKGFWVNLSPGGLVGLYVLAGMGGAVTGFCGIWLVHYLLEWLVLGFCGDKSKDE